MNWLQRVRSFFKRADEQQLDEELRFHIDKQAEANIASGMTPQEARRQAMLAFGNVPLTKEDTRAVWAWTWLEQVCRDVRYALRVLRRSATFTMIAILTLALGIGANTAIFSLVDRVLLRSLPYLDGEQLVILYESPLGEADRNVVSPANWLDWQEQSQSFESLAAWGAGEFSWQMNLIGEGAAERLNGQHVSEEFFPLLKVAPLLGRVFVPEEYRSRVAIAGVSDVVILSHGLWQRRFGGDPNVIGRIINLEGLPVEIVGVMPQGFQFVWSETDFWAPLRLDLNRDWRAIGARVLQVVGRLKPSVTPAAAQAEMEVIADRLAQAHPFNQDTSVKVVPLRDELVGEAKTSLWVLFAAVGGLLLIACSNFAGLLLARAAYRRPETTVRAALGAGRSAILRQWLAESLLLTLAGGILGVIVARSAVTTMIALVPRDLIEINAAPLDSRMLLYTLGLSLLTGVVFGLAPAIMASRVSLANDLRTAGRATVRSTRIRQVFVMAQIALTVVLLCGSALLARSFWELTRTDTGLEPRDVLTLNVGLDGEPYDDRGEAYVVFYQQAIEQLENLPGVRSASVEQNIPVTGWSVSRRVNFHIEGAPQPPPSERPSTSARMVAPGYFRTVGIPILRGRDFSVNDQRESPLVFMVNRTFANTFFPDRDPLSASISLLGGEENIYGRIVGIVGDVKEGSLRGQAYPTVFHTYSQIATSTDMILFIKAENARGLTRAAVQVIREIDPNVPVYEERLLEDVFGESIARERLIVVLSSAFALTALLLAACGVFGLLSFQVAERTREIGLRMALGARSSQVLRMVLGQSLRLVIPGVILGLAGALALTQLIEGLLYGIAPRDPSTFAGVIALIIGVGAVAAFLPARRATQVDPLIALRQE